jgi:predicted HicB family RNase H-like nuclease
MSRPARQAIRKPAHKADQYTYTIQWSKEDEVYIGRVAEFASLAAHGDTREGALREITFVVQAVLEDLAESHEPIPEPLGGREFSGKLNLRMPKQLHRQLATEAAHQGVSLNDWLNHKLEK